MRLSLLVFLALFPALANGRPVILPGQEALFLEMGTLNLQGVTLEGVSIERSAATFTFTYDGKRFTLRLGHPAESEKRVLSTVKFAIFADEDVPETLLAAFERRVRDLESRFEWAMEANGEKTQGRFYKPALPSDAIPFELLPVTMPPVPEQALAPLREALDLLKMRKKLQAEQKALSVLQSNQESVSVAIVVARVLRGAGKPKKAVKILKPFASQKNRDVAIEYAASLLAAGMVREAKRFLPEPTECALVEALSILAREGNYEQALKHTPPLQDNSQRCVAAFHLKLAHATGDSMKVDQVAEKVLSMFPNDEAFLYLWGYHYYASKKLEGAIAPWEHLLAINVRFPAALGQLGTAYLVSGRLNREGVDKMLKRLQENQSDIVASFLAGLGFYYLKEYSKVIPLLEPVVRAVPDEARARLYLAMAHYFLGSFEKAQQMFEEMEYYAHHDPDIYYCRSLIYRKRDLPRAIREMEKFLEVFTGEGRMDFGPEKVKKARSDLERMRKGEVPELNLPGEPYVPAM